MVISPMLSVFSKTWKSDSFDNLFWQQFKSNTSDTYLRKCMAFKVVKHINPLGSMKSFTKNNCNLCIEECLTILKKLCDKRATLMNNNLDIDGAYWHKTTFYWFLLNRVLSPSVLDPKSQSRNRKSNRVLCTKSNRVPCKQHTYALICATTIYDVQDHNR